MQLRRQAFDCDDLLELGYSYADLLAAGFSGRQLACTLPTSIVRRLLNLQVGRRARAPADEERARAKLRCLSRAGRRAGPSDGNVCCSGGHRRRAVRGGLQARLCGLPPQRELAVDVSRRAAPLLRTFHPHPAARLPRRCTFHSVWRARWRLSVRRTSKCRSAMRARARRRRAKKHGSTPPCEVTPSYQMPLSRSLVCANRRCCWQTSLACSTRRTPSVFKPKNFSPVLLHRLQGVEPPLLMPSRHTPELCTSSRCLLRPTLPSSQAAAHCPALE